VPEGVFGITARSQAPVTNYWGMTNSGTNTSTVANYSNATTSGT